MISFEPLAGGNWRTKVALRGFGVRCVMIREQAEPCATQGRRNDDEASRVNTAEKGTGRL